MRIGVFDSGFGGLNVFGYISKQLKEHDLIYLGDTARAPYGNLSQEMVYEYVKEGIDFLFSQDCKLVVLACNTASAEALRKIQQEYIPEKYSDRNVLGVLIPVAEEVVNITINKRVGILATESTVSSGAYIREIHKLDSDIEVFQQAAPLLVPIVESGEDNEVIFDEVIGEYLHPLLEKQVDTIILGCTHYGILKDRIIRKLKEMNVSINIISGESVIAEKLSNYLERHSEYEFNLSKNGHREFYTTDGGNKFDKFGSKIFGKKIKSVKVSLG